MPRFLKYLLATFRLHKGIVCEMSAGLGLNDFHDYPDGEFNQPWHFYNHRCKRCKKEFWI